METNQLVLKENQKEDFVKELPLVTDYCSKIASLPKVVCESEFLRSFFRSNLSNSSITIANDSNSPNRQINANNNKSLSAHSSAEKKTSSVNKKLIQTENSQTLTTEPSVKIETSTTLENLIKNTSESTSTLATESQQQIELSDSVSTASKTSFQNESAGQTKNSGSVNTSLVKTKPHATTVSVANLMNPEINYNKLVKNQPQKGSERVASTDPIIRQASLPPPTTNAQHLIPPYMLPGGQLLTYPYQIQNIYNQHPQLHHPYSTSGNLNQPLHLHTFQPISNMIIGSPPCASPTATNTNPHSLSNSRSNSPWMMMPPPQAPQLSNSVHSASGQLNSIPNSQHFYPSHLSHNPRSSFKTGSNSNLKDVKHQQQYYSNQEDLLLRYALDNSINYNSNLNMQPAMNSMDESFANLSNERTTNRNIGKISENSLKYVKS